jgi:hypothetical protein
LRALRDFFHELPDVITRTAGLRTTCAAQASITGFIRFSVVRPSMASR